MGISENRWIIIATAFVVLGAVGFGYWQDLKNRVPAFPINSADTISSWDFKGAYTGNDTLIANANADIKKLTDLLGKGEYDDYDLYLGIGNDKALLGDGKGSYDFYNRSIHIHPKKGLAYANLGHLMDVLRAYHTATDALAEAVAVEPGMLEYHLERLTFLTRQFPDDTVLVEAGFADAHKQFGSISQVLAIRAEWLTTLKRYTEAIATWQEFIQISPGRDVSAAVAAIARLRAKQ